MIMTPEVMSPVEKIVLKVGSGTIQVSRWTVEVSSLGVPEVEEIILF